MKNKTNDEFYETDYNKILKSLDDTFYNCEVLYNLGEQEVIKKEGKYFLSSTINPNIQKEISRKSALELGTISNSNNQSKNNYFYE